MPTGFILVTILTLEWWSSTLGCSDCWLWNMIDDHQLLASTISETKCFVQLSIISALTMKEVLYSQRHHSWVINAFFMLQDIYLLSYLYIWHKNGPLIMSFLQQRFTIMPPYYKYIINNSSIVEHSVTFEPFPTYYWMFLKEILGTIDCFCLTTHV